MVEPTQVRALVAEALKQGADSVEEVHRKIQAMPLDALRRYGLGDLANSVEGGTASAYEAVREAGDQITHVAHDFLSQVPGTDADLAPPPPEK